MIHKNWTVNTAIIINTMIWNKILNANWNSGKNFSYYQVLPREFFAIYPDATCSDSWFVHLSLKSKGTDKCEGI